MKQHLICPVCGGALAYTENRKSLLCKGEKVHCFDLSSSGYVNLALHHKQSGDAREAVRARIDFLEKGYYKPFAEALETVVADYVKEGPLLDAGCGTGYYTNRIAKACGLPTVGFDLSKPAIDAAAKASRQIENVFYAVAGIYHMPLADASVGGVLNVFAPCATEEFFRVLRKNGVLIVAGAGKEHLWELKRAVYDTAYENEARADLPTSMSPVETRTVSYQVTIDNAEDIRRLFAMTPYSYRTSAEGLARLARLDTLTVSVDIDLSIYRK